MSDPLWDDLAGVEQDEAAGVIDVEGVRYNVDEANELIGYLRDPRFALFDRFLKNIRDFSVDIMDSGSVTADTAQELIRHSAMRLLIVQVRGMAKRLEEQVQASAVPESKDVDN